MPTSMSEQEPEPEPEPEPGLEPEPEPEPEPEREFVELGPALEPEPEPGPETKLAAAQPDVPEQAPAPVRETPQAARPQTQLDRRPCRGRRRRARLCPSVA